MSNWFCTNEADDVVGSLRHALVSFELAVSDPHAWKWVILALHSALQGASVCHLTTTAQPVGALTKASTCEWLEYFEVSRENKDAKRPSTHILALPELLKAVRREKSAGDGSQHAIIEISDSDLKWLTRIHKEVRNPFTHFEPMGWSLEVSGIRELARIVSRIIRSIQHADWAFRHLEVEQKQSLSESLDRLATM